MKNQKYIDELKWRLQTFRKLDALDFMNAMGNYLDYPETDSLLNDHEMMYPLDDIPDNWIEEVYKLAEGKG